MAASARASGAFVESLLIPGGELYPQTRLDNSSFWQLNNGATLTSTGATFYNAAATNESIIATSPIGAQSMDITFTFAHNTSSSGMYFGVIDGNTASTFLGSGQFGFDGASAPPGIVAKIDSWNDQHSLLHRNTVGAASTQVGTMGLDPAAGGVSIYRFELRKTGSTTYSARLLRNGTLLTSASGITLSSPTFKIAFGAELWAGANWGLSATSFAAASAASISGAFVETLLLPPDNVKVEGFAVESVTANTVNENIRIAGYATEAVTSNPLIEPLRLSGMAVEVVTFSYQGIIGSGTGSGTTAAATLTKIVYKNLVGSGSGSGTTTGAILNLTRLLVGSGVGVGTGTAVLSSHYALVGAGTGIGTGVGTLAVDTSRYLAAATATAGLAGSDIQAWFELGGATAALGVDSSAPSLDMDTRLLLQSATATVNAAASPVTFGVIADITASFETGIVSMLAPAGLSWNVGNYVQGAFIEDPAPLGDSGTFTANLLGTVTVPYADDYDFPSNYWATLLSGESESGELYFYGPITTFGYYMHFGYGETLNDFTIVESATFTPGDTDGASISTYLSGGYNRIVIGVTDGVAQNFEIGYAFDPGSASTLLDVEVLTNTIVRTPSVLQVAVMNAAPWADVTFRVDGGAVIATETADSSGTITSIALQVSGLAAGGHTITAESGLATAFGDFTVQEAEIARPTTPTTDAPPANIAQTGVRKWIFQDLAPGGLGTYVFPINPSKMSNPYADRAISERVTVSGEAFHLFEAQPGAHQWNFGGKGLTKAFYDKLVAFAELNRRFYVIDHQNRAWVCVISSFDPVMGRRRHTDEQYFFDYSVSAVILDGPIDPV